MDVEKSKTDRITLHKRIDRYLDQGYGAAWLKDRRVARMVEDDLLSFDGKSFRLSAWVVMPNHIHFLGTRFETQTLSAIMQSLKSLTSHKANRLLFRKGHFWMPDYYDRYVRNAEHYIKTIQYIERNPVKAGLCDRPEEWPFSSARWREGAGEGARVPS